MPTSHLIICRTDHIGDAVVTLPLIGYLKRKYPHMTIGFLCRSYVAPIAQHCRSVDYVIEADQITDPVSALAHTGADSILFFPTSERKWIKAAKKAGIQMRIGTQHKLSHWFYCTHRTRFKRSNTQLHETQLSFQLLAPLGISAIPTLKEIAQLHHLEAPPYLGAFLLEKTHFNLILHPKSHGNGREWPIQHYVALVNALAQYKNIHCWITGSEKEGIELEKQTPELFNPANTSNLCGKLSLTELLSFINTADGLIASGTGPLHISAALGKPTLGLFPPIAPINPTRWAPLGARAEFLCQKTLCESCENNDACLCMLAITPEQVAEVVLRWVNLKFSVHSLLL